MADQSKPGIEVQFTVPLPALDAGLAAAEQKVAASSARIDQKLQGRPIVGSILRGPAYRRQKEAADLGEEMVAALEDVKPKVFHSGQAAGDEYARGVESRIAKRLAAGAFKFALIGAFDSALRGVADAIKNGGDAFDIGVSIANRVAEGIKSVPIAGAFYELGQGLSDTVAPEYDKENHAQWLLRMWSLGGYDARQPSGSTRGMRGEFGDLNKAKADAAAVAAAADRDWQDRAMREADAIDERFNEQERARQAAADAAMRDQEEADRARITAQRKMFDAAVDDRQSKLALIKDMMGGVGSLDANDFIGGGQTAIGQFRVAQADAGRMVAENTKTLVGLQEDANRLLDEIKRIEMQRNDLR